MNQVKVSFRDSIVYGLGNIAVKVIGFLLIPLYTNPKYFSVDDFGIIAVLDITGLVLISVMGSGLPQSLMRWYWDRDHRDNQKGIFFMSLAAQVIISLAFILLISLTSNRISTLIFHDTGWSRAIKLLVLSSALQAVNNLVNTLMRLQARSVLFTIANMTKLVAVLVLTIFLIVNRGMGIEGIYLAQVIGNTLFIILLSGYTFINSSPFFNLKVFREMSRYGFPLLLANFAAASLTVIDRYSLNSLAPLKYVAIYTMAFKISSVLKLVIVDSIKMAVTPLVFKKMNSPDNKRFYARIMLYSSFVLMLGIITISLFSSEIISIISRSREFGIAFMIVPLLALSVFFTNLRETTSYGLIIRKKTGIIGATVVISGFLNIGLNLLLIPAWNIAGAATATLFTQVVFWALNYYFSQKEYHIPFETKKIVLLFITGAALSCIGLFVNGLDLVPRLAIKLFSILIFPFILYFFVFYEVSELQALKGFYRKWSNLKAFRSNIKSLKDLSGGL